jgi:hypothetical protein
MFRVRHLVMSLPIVVFSSAVCPAADPPAIAALKEKGLTRSGRLFVIEDEQAVMEKWKSTRAVLAEYTAAAGRARDAEQAASEAAQLEERRAALQQNLNALDLQIGQQALPQGGNRGGFGQAGYYSQLISQRNMIRMQLDQIASMQKSARTDPRAEKKMPEEDGKKSLEGAKAALVAFRESVDAVTKRYDQLGADASVKAALRTLEKDKLGTFKLGPSSQFKAVVKSLENAERMILAKKTTTVSRKKVRLKK